MGTIVLKFLDTSLAERESLTGSRIMEKKIRFKSKDPELWEKIEAVYPDKSEEYKKEIYDQLCSETRIATLKHQVAILEDTITLKEQLAKQWSRKGGKAEKELKGVLKAIKMILPKVEKKDPFSLFNHFVKYHKGVESALNIPIKGGVCKVFAMMGEDKKGNPRVKIYQILGVSDEDLDDSTLEGIVLPTLRKYVRKVKQK